MATAKEAAIAMIQKLPDDCTWEEILYQVHFRTRIEQGIADCDAGRVTPHEVFKAERLFVIALGVDARPAKARIGFGHHHGEAERTVKSVFSSFHEPEEIRVMHDAGHVRVGKFHAPRRFEFVRHTSG